MRFWRPPCYRYTNPPGRRVILGARARAAGSAEEAQAVERPDARVDPADQPRLGHRPEVARVDRVAAPVAEHDAFGAQHMPRGRWNHPEGAADVVAMLLSDAAASITGAVIDAEGGFRRWTP